ncbi:MAG: tail tape measure protein [Sphingomonadales bacterium]
MDEPFDGAYGDAVRQNVDAHGDLQKAQDASTVKLKEFGLEGVRVHEALSKSLSGFSSDMANVFDRFAKTGKLSFADLKSAAIGTLDDIYSQAVSSGLNSLFGGGDGGFFGGLLKTVLTPFSFAPRATGGPVSEGRAYLVGENGPEIFMPRGGGEVVAPSKAANAVNVTVNVAAGASAPALRQSASQIASQVSRAVTRAQRNG